MQPITLDIQTQRFIADIIDNPTTQALLKKFPMTLHMTDHLNNEKYAQLNSPLPHQDEAVSHINAGDIMLYQGNTIVIFYDSFDTPYRYTRLGKIQKAQELKNVLGTGAVAVVFHR